MKTARNMPGRTATLRLALKAVAEMTQFEAGCGHPEDHYAILQDGRELRSALRFWFRRLRVAEKAERQGRQEAGFER